MIRRTGHEAVGATVRWREGSVLVLLGALLLTLGLLPAGCGGGGGGGGSRLATSFFVIDQTPQTPYRFPMSGEPGFDDTNNQLVLLFTAPVDRASVLDPNTLSGTTASIRITDSGGTRVRTQAFVGGRDALGNPPNDDDETIKADGPNVLRIVADTDGDLNTVEAFSLSDGSEFTIFVSGSARSAGGSLISKAFCATYYVGLSTGNPPPVATSTSPPANSDGVALREPIVVNFSEEINAESIIGLPGSPDRPRNIVIQATNPMTGVMIPSRQLTGTVTQTFPGSNCSFTFTPDSSYPGTSVITVKVKSLADPNFPANQGVTDMLDRPLVPFFARPAPQRGDFVFSFRTRAGDPIANNPVPPQAVFFGAMNPGRFGVIGSDGTQDFNGNPFPTPFLDTNNDGLPNAADDNVISPNSENTTIGRVASIEVGRPLVENRDPNCILFTAAGPVVITATGNYLDQPPFPNPPPPPPINSTATCVFNACGAISLIPSRTNADLGFHVYVADADQKVIHVINSITSRVLETIATPDPTGMTTTPDARTLLVTNFNANTVSVIDIDSQSPRRHQVVKTIPVGIGPRGISAQPDNEDIFVCNSIENSLSIIDVGSLSVRKSLISLIGPEPWDVTVSQRQPPVFPFGTGTYFAFITNRAGDSVSIFESGPSSPVFFGPDDINQVFSEGPGGPFKRPMGIVNNRRYGTLAGALFVCNGNDTLAEIQLTGFQRPPTPNFPSPGELRTFTVLRQNFANEPFNPIRGAPTDIAVSDAVLICPLGPTFANSSKSWHTQGTVSGLGGVRVYVATANRIVVLDRRTYLPLAEIPIPGVEVVETFFN